MIRRHDRSKKPARAKRLVRRQRQAPRESVGAQRPRQPLAEARTLGKRSRSWLRARWLPLATGVLLLGVAGAGAAAWHSPLLRVQKVEITGTVDASERNILDRVDLLGERMFTANLDATAAAVVELPLIASVDIERRWPSTVRITVHEREPWGSWEQAGVRYTIDHEGFVLGHREPPPGSTTIVSNESYSLRAGDRVNPQAVEAATAIGEHIEEALGTQVVELTYSPDEGIRVRTADGQTALLGDSSGIAYKLAVWARVTREATARELTYSAIDLRFGDRPVLR